MGDQRIAVSIAVPYPLQVKNRLQAEPQFGSYVRVTNAGWPGEGAIGYGEARLLTCLAGGSGCLNPGNDDGYTPMPRPADFVTPFDVVVILEGVNDVKWEAAPSQVRDAMKRMADSARARGVAVLMTRMTSYKLSSYVDNTDWLPAAQQMNNLIWTLTEQEGLDRVSFDVEMCPDGIHPTDWGYGQMGTAAATKLQQMFPVNAVP